MSDSSSSGAVQAALGALAEFTNASSGDIALGSQTTQVAGRETFPSHYWRKPDGWVCIQPGWPTEAGYLYERGFSSLKSRFGVFYPRNPDGWNITLEPWRRIFAMSGQDVFPIEQILEFGWHRKPPYPGKDFPQIKKIDTLKWEILTGPRAGEIHEDILCPACNKPHLSRADLRRHEAVAHKETSQSNEMARTIADAQTRGLESLSGPMGEAIRMLAEGQRQQGEVLAALVEKLSAPTPAAKDKPAA